MTPQPGGQVRAVAAVQDLHRPVPPPRWWKITGPERETALDRLRAWVEQIYRPGYGQLATTLPPCWEHHPTCLYILDWLSELWSLLYLTPQRDGRTLAAQAADQLLAALSRNTPAFRTAVQHGRHRGLLAALSRSSAAFGAPDSPRATIFSRRADRSVRGGSTANPAPKVPAEHETALDLAAGADVIVLPRLDRVLERAAAQDRRQVQTELVSPSRDTRWVLREAGPDEVELVVETSRPLSDDQVVPVRVAGAGQHLDYLVVLSPEASGLNVGDLVISGVGASLVVAVRDPQPAASLDLDDVPAIRRSVRATAVAGRNAWRAIARGRAADDPVRRAIADEL